MRVIKGQRTSLLGVQELEVAKKGMKNRGGEASAGTKSDLRLDWNPTGETYL